MDVQEILFKNYGWLATLVAKKTVDLVLNKLSHCSSTTPFLQEKINGCARYFVRKFQLVGNTGGQENSRLVLNNVSLSH
jgi:hypothetical protein